MDRTHDLETRLAALETEHARFRRAAARYRTLALGLGLVATALVAVAADGIAPVADVIQAKRFEVVDDEGNLVLAASADASGGALDLWTKDGANVFRATSNEFGGDLNVWNRGGGVVLGAFASGTGGEISLWGGGAAPAARLVADAAGGHVRLAGAGGRGAASLGAVTGGGTRLDLGNAEGRTMLTLDASNPATAELALSNGAGDRRAVLTADARGGGLSILGAAGQSVVTAGTGLESGGGQLEIANAGGTPVLTALADLDGCGRLDVAIKDGRNVFTLDAIPDTGAAIGMFNAGGRRCLLVGSRAEGGLLNLFNQNEVPVVVAGYARLGLGGAVTVKNARGIPVVHAASTIDDDGELTVFNLDGERARKVLPLPRLN